jgi:hypothetical protein
MAVEHGGAKGAQTVLLCGTVARGDVRGTWGPPKHPCP